MANFKSPNPSLQLEGSPFRIPAGKEPWPRGASPRIAGVSSFGWGGTNAHVIVQEAPESPPGDKDEGPQLIVVSARSEKALGEACKRLSNHFTAHPERSLADDAHTLQTGRTEHEYRVSVVARSAAEAAEALRGAASKARRADPRPRIAFLFPGQGSQYEGMGLGLRESSPAFRRAFDECVASVEDVIGENFVDVLKDAAKLKRTRYTQPAIFALSYSLARHWESWGILPEASIGHSVGEFAAAAIAGVMKPGDAARLTALRGALVDACPPGGMLAVKMDAEALAGILPEGVEIAARNSPSSQVVSGPFGPIESFEKVLAERGVAARRLETSHAFHSAMMDEAIASFREEISKVELSPPRRAFVSTLTGDWIRPEEAVDPEYWARHMRESVHFSQAAETLLAMRDFAFLEVGPRDALSKLMLQHGGAKGRAVCPSLAKADPASEAEGVLDALGALWKSGVEVDWGAVRGGRRRLKAKLPSYPFQGTRHWIDPPRPAGKAADAVADTPLEIAIGEKEEAQKMSETRKPKVLQALYKVLEDLSGIALSPDDASHSYAELGLDSLLLSQAAISASKTFGLKLKLRHFVEEFPTPSALVDYLDSQMPAEAFAADAKPAPAAARPAAPQPAAPQPAAQNPAAVFASSAVPPQAFPAAPSFAGTGLESLIAQQMEIMRQQLAVLSGAGLQQAVPLASSPAPGAWAPAAAPAAPAAQASATQAAPAASEPREKEQAESKPVKPHGPQLVIDRVGHKDMSPSQEKTHRNILERYEARTRKSKEFTQRNRAFIADPRAVAGFKPQMKEMIYPIVVDRSAGCRLWDLDGNEYVDLLSGYGSNFFGFGAPFVKEALARQMEIGMEIGPQAKLIEDVSRLFREFVPMDRIAFCNTGSEAVLAALRIARTATRKDLIVMFSGGYHGIFDEVVVRSGAKGKSVPAAVGIPGQATENVLLLDWAADESLEIIRQRASEIAAVITEPVQSRRPEIVPAEFHKKLRKVTEENGIALIFDEVVTGFRIGPGGAQEYFGVKADIATYGKVIGGGISIGIVAGKKEYMDALDGGHWQYGDSSVPEAEVTYFAGTFVRHPLALAVTVAALEELKKGGRKLYDDLNAQAEWFAEELNTLFEREGVQVKLLHFGSVMKIEASHDLPFYELLFILLRMRGVHCWDGRPCFMTLAHTRKDLEFVIKAFRDSIAELQEGGFYPKPVRQESADKPPVEGAKLGRDASGNPAWFVPDPAVKGGFVQFRTVAK